MKEIYGTRTLEVFFFSPNFYFPHYTVVIKAHIYVFSECKCHRLKYLGWLSTSKRVGLLQNPNLRIFAQLFRYQTDSQEVVWDREFKFTNWDVFVALIRIEKTRQHCKNLLLTVKTFNQAWWNFQFPQVWENSLF
jgi:hypothetical protein